MKEALLYEKLPESKVHCHLCHHRCQINEGQKGLCRVRENRGGTLYTLVYGQLISRNVDPIEKKPMFHFAPGTLSFSIATVGCNFRCDFCQNYEISQMPKDQKRIIGEEVSAGEIVAMAKRRGCQTISYTYTEPTIFFEYALEIARLATKEGLKNIFVTNGYMTRETLNTIHPHLHGANVDLKSFRQEFYQKRCGAKLAGVLESLKVMKELGVWVEITTLIIPGLNDDEEELKDIAEFIFSLGKETPWHISRFHPMYRLLDRPSTPISTLERAREIGLKAGLRYVYTGNVPGDVGEDTFCYQCGSLLVDRFGFQILKYQIKENKCYKCGAEIDGVDLGGDRSRLRL
ncbi:MAG: AmmeMemoRadiSam system radical SAM enzyme [Thermodesulfobacteriota bacterium]